MRCQSCDKNDATTTVICESCQSYYASIREGQFREQELAMGEFQLRVTSWMAVTAPVAKKAAREDKVQTKKRGLFGKKAAPEPEVEQEPPPDWKNRVFPTEEAAPAPVEEAPAEEQAYQPSSFSYELPVDEAAEPAGSIFEAAAEVAAAGADVVAAAPAELASAPFELTAPFASTSAPFEVASEPFELEAAPLELELAPAPVELGASLELDAAAPAGLTSVPFELVPAEPISAPFELASVPLELAPAGQEVELAHEPETSFFAEAAAAPPVEAPAPTIFEAPKPTREPELPQGLSDFFNSLNKTADAPVAEVEAPAEAASQAGLAGFFESLGTTAEPVAAAPEAAPAPSTGLSDFFASLNEPPPPAAAAPVEAPTGLGDFFETLSEAASEPMAETAAAPAGGEEFFESLPAMGGGTGQLSDFFSSLEAPVEEVKIVEAPAPVVEAAVEPAVSFEAPQAAPAFDAPQAPPAFEASQVLPSPEAPQASPAFEAPQASPAFEAPQAPAPASEASQMLSSFEAPEAASVFDGPEAASVFEAQQAAPAPETAAPEAAAFGFAVEPAAAFELPVPEAAAEPPAQDFFAQAAAKLAGSSELAPSFPPVEAVAEVPLAGPQAQISEDLASFFESITPGEGSPKPFSIEIELPGAPKKPAVEDKPAGVKDRPPTHGQPFAIDLGGIAPAPPQPSPKKKAADDLKKAHSTGSLAFVGDDEEEEEPTGFGLLDGLAYEKNPGARSPGTNSNAGHRGFDDDDDDSKTIDL